MQRRDVILTAAAAVMLPAAARANAQTFDSGWTPLTFRNIPATRYSLQGARVGILAERSSSVIWRAVAPDARSAGRASWTWQVTRSVPPTDLTRRGGDDRNIALYAVFMDAASAARLSPDTSLTRLLANRSARSLIYVWGGAHARGDILPNPWTRGRGVSVILRAAGTGAHSERVDLYADHARAFGNRPEALVGLALSSDSDDTGSVAEATLADLRLD